MAKLHRVLVVLCLFLAPAVFAQSADQEVVSVVDSPDPVTPGSTLSYTVTVRNNGPNAATNGGLNINLAGALTHTTDVVPAGWTCFWSGNNGTCNTPSFAAGTTEVLTINATVGSHLAAFPDQDITSNFFPSGTTADPNNGNNTKTSTTTVNSPQVDLSVVASDSPDPVAPDGHVTYDVTVTNSGPDTASSVNFNVVPNSSLQFVSAAVPAGWNCTLPSVGAVNATFTCSRATWAPGSSNFDVVFAANDEQFGINDTTFQTFFSVNAGASDETDDGSDNQVAVTTAYQTPDADITVSVVDSPDPVAPDGDITYTVTVGNTGPNTAPNVTLNSFGGNNLRFVSASVPAGWNCTLPAANAQTAGWTCTLASMVSGDSDVLTFVLEASQDLNGINDGTILFGFSANSSISDPDNSDNSETESTAYSTADADISVTVTDAPDPVAPDGDITYTVTVANAGPDTAPNVTLNSFGGNNVRFVSASVPAGWNCTLPAPGAQTAGWTCTLASMASGDSDVLTFVIEASQDLNGINDGNILFGFSAGSGVSDPNNSNNSETESTAYVTPDADVFVSVSDSPDPVGPDGNITYTVTVGNSGPDTAPDVTLSSFGANNLRFVSASVPAGWNCTLPAAGTQTTSLTCTLASMASGDSDVLTFVMQADADLIGNSDTTILFGFSANSSVSDPDGDDNSETESTVYDVPNANLGVAVTDAPDPVAAGSNITYTGSLNSGGPDTAINVTFTVPLAPGLLFVSLSDPAGFSCTEPAVGTNGTITCTAPSLASGASVPFTLVAQVDPALNNGPDGTIEQTFLIGSATNDPIATNNEREILTAYTTPDADISVTNSDNPDPVAPGGGLTYTQTITNNGPNNAVNATFTQTLPPSVGFVALDRIGPVFTCSTPAVGASGAITCTAASLPSGATTIFTVVVDVLASSGTIGNTVIGDSDTFDPDNTDNQASVATTIIAPASADLSITKNTTATSASPGDSIQYTIAVTNAGPDDATTVVMTDTLPAGLLFQSITEPAGFDCVTPAAGTNGTITCTGATLADGATATFTLTVTVADGADSGNVTNSASVASATGDPDGGDTSGSAPAITLGPAIADLSITKTTGATAAPAGSTISYTITVTNAGLDAAEDVEVTDVLPAELLFVSITEPAGFDCTTPAVGANGTITCTGATLANGASASFTLTVRVADDAVAGSVTNSASVSSMTTDSDGGDTSDPAPPVALGPAAADVSITKTTTTTDAETGDTVFFTITVSNAGPSTATDVTVTDELPSGLTLVLASPSQGSCSGTTTINCDLGDLLAGGSATITLQTTVTATSGTISNTAFVSSADADPDGGDNSDSTPPFPVGSPAEVAQVPTLSEWALIALAMMLGAVALTKMRM
jgi:uncharacterized repeat protein (TIGR01451 family)